MKRQRFVTTCGLVVGALLMCGLVVTSVQAQFVSGVIGEAGGVSVVSEPQEAPDGYWATKVILQSAEGTKLVTFENLDIGGELHQVWIPGLFGATETKSVDAFAQVPAQDWAQADSHLLVTSAMVGGGAGGSYAEIHETNDQSNIAGGNENLTAINGTVAPVTGVGGIAMQAPTDAFFLDPAFQTNSVELALIVWPEAAGTADGHLPALTLGVLGEGIADSGQPGGASWGVNAGDAGALAIPFVPEPSTALLGMMAGLGLLALRRR